MKTAILQLEPYDNRYSICDRMEWNHVDRILIVWPKRSKQILDEQDLIYIKRQAQNLGLQLALVCREDRVAEMAAALSLSIFPSVPSAESSRWLWNRNRFAKKEDTEFLRQVLEESGTRKKNRFSSALQLITRIVAIVLGVAAIISLLVFLIPSAQVTIYPKTHQKQITVAIWASPQFHEFNINGNLPAFVKQVELSGSAQGVSSGTTGIPNTPASGEVTLTNLTNEAVVVAKGSVIDTGTNPVIRYATNAEISVPAGSEVTATVGVTALQAGAEGNQPSGALDVVEGTLGAELNVTNELAMSGGLDEQSPSPTEQDYTKLQDQLLKQLHDQANSEIASTGEVLIANTLDDGDVISAVRSLEPGQPGEQIGLTLTVRFSGLVYLQTDLDQLVHGALNASLSSNEINYSGRIQSVIEKASAVALTGKEARWQQVVTAQVGPAIDSNSLAQSLAGKSLAEGLAFLQTSFPADNLPQIKFFPFDLQRFPFAGYRIQILVQP